MSSQSDTKKINDALREAGSLHAKQRTEDIIQKVRSAIAIMENEIKSNGGIYPENAGRLTQSEVCRRAGIAKITLHSPSHKDTTRLEVDSWIADHPIKRKPEVRKSVTERADFWKAEHAKVASQICIYELQLNEKNIEIRELKGENRGLREQLARSGASESIALQADKR